MNSSSFALPVQFGPGPGLTLDGPRTITNFRDSFVVSKSKARVFEQTDNLQMQGCENSDESESSWLNKNELATYRDSI